MPGELSSMNSSYLPTFHISPQSADQRKNFIDPIAHFVATNNNWLLAQENTFMCWYRIDNSKPENYIVFTNMPTSNALLNQTQRGIIRTLREVFLPIERVQALAVSFCQDYVDVWILLDSIDSETLEYEIYERERKVFTLLPDTPIDFYLTDVHRHPLDSFDRDSWKIYPRDRLLVHPWENWFISQ